LEAFDRERERHLKLEGYSGRGWSSRESLSRILRLGRKRPSQDDEESEQSEHKSV
jgi:hypothetical protein